MARHRIDQGFCNLLNAAPPEVYTLGEDSDLDSKIVRMDAATPEPLPNPSPSHSPAPHVFGERSPNEDAAARAERVNRIREEINAGTYDTPDKIKVALDRLFDLLQSSR